MNSKKKFHLFKKILFLFLLIFILFGFYQINEINYKKHLEIRENLVNHPEWLPTKEVALNTSFWYKNLRADLYRLQAIQYIWWNVISSDYKKYLFKMLDLITELNPFFEHPYVIWELLLPEYNQRYENLTKEEQDKTIEQGLEIWHKWVRNFCDISVVDKIKKENNLIEIQKNPIYKDPCKTYTIPYYLAYIYFFNKKDQIESSNYYKVSSANSDSVEWAKTMAAIMQWKWWNRWKSFLMFLDLARSVGQKDEVCDKFSAYLQERVLNSLSQNNNDEIIKNLDSNTIKEIQDNRLTVFWEFDEETDKKWLSNTDCSNYINKAVRELNMAYVEKWNEKFKKENNWKSAKNAKILFEQKYLDFLPTDFQQYKTYWIIYEYNDEIGKFDYKMWNY